MDGMTLRPVDGHMITLETNRRAVATSVWRGRRAGSRFCPHCLTERDGRWVLRWRFVLGVRLHPALLHDHCSRCGKMPRHEGKTAAPR
ncbi:TniQ family protein [Kibdelosporangium persicum]|uniref:TniQ family protein n=1 Tax=Kibdelosporangium persicum TaxID=2698649 RepID=UPI0035E42AE9